MPYKTIIETKCSQCYATAQFERLDAAQKAGWQAVGYRPIGSSSESTGSHSGDLCPECFAVLKATMMGLPLKPIFEAS
jgi:hypothetical protein